MRIKEDRRALHRIPELDKNLPRTLGYLEHALAGLNCRVFSPMEGALCAWFDLGRETAIAFRADMDALPVQERNDTPYASTIPGQMHACGTINKRIVHIDSFCQSLYYKPTNDRQ